MTDRMVAAIEHPLVDAIGHPTGRKIERRKPYALDMDRVIEAAARTGTMIEINSAPDRRDLDDVHARAAAQAGVRILINSDAHGAETLGNTRWGVATARRAWLTPADVANTLPCDEFVALRKPRGAERRSRAVGEDVRCRSAARAGARSATTRSTASRPNGATAARARSA